ncbi:hypothetical protein [Sedimentitalea todarodis]|uniref:Uncharacterized protein n=1 Tax=Sedimentitalea todarodis TaxID=1631240 RepID=A0ABU3VD92_9RHOB|nr:hypothetical protein [Sedimentitalea todarodis]MDU9004000.1 hypothetical protein [Sedimentitalea todarodis]
MTEPQDIEATTTALLASMREKLGVRANTLQGARTAAKRLLPRRVFKSYEFLQETEPFLAHPKLARTVDVSELAAATKDVRAYLDGIDLADRRKGWWLSLAGSLAFNLLALCVLVIAVLVWRGIL